MDCTRTGDHLSAYLDGDLPENEREGIEHHLRQCTRCAEEERALKETLSLLRDLPAGKAPPGLLEGIARRLAGEQARPPLWKKLFLPAHIKIPLEAAAVALVFLLAYGIQKEMPSPNVPPAPASVGSVRPETTTVAPGVRRKPVVLPGRTAEGTGQDTGKMEVPRRTAAAAREAMRPAEGSGHRTESANGQAKAGLPSIPATRVSTGGTAIGPFYPETPPAAESFVLRTFPPAESRVSRPLPHEREVTIEVSPEDRAGLPDRISDVVLHLGGTFHREITMTAGGPGAGEASPLREIIRVVLPSDRAGVFLEEMGMLGTILPSEGAVQADSPAGQAPDTVAYMVRVRVR